MTHPNHDIARAFFAALSSGNIPDDLMTDDATIWTTSSAKIADKAGFQFGIRLLASIFEGGLSYTIHSLTAEDDRVAAEVSSKGNLINGSAYEGNYMFLLKVRGGKISFVAEHNDPRKVNEQLGPLIQEVMAKARG